MDSARSSRLRGTVAVLNNFGDQAVAPYFYFMTGTKKFRLEAENIEEAIRFALEELRPDENMKAVILSTMREEVAGDRTPPKARKSSEND